MLVLDMNLLIFILTPLKDLEQLNLKGTGTSLILILLATKI